MAINTGQLHIEATDMVLAALTELYKDTEPDPDAMRGFAEAIASIAVATAEHFRRNRLSVDRTMRMKKKPTA